MTARLIAPVIPPASAPPHRPGAAERAGTAATARSLPTAVAPVCPVLPADIVYRLASIDTSGRICDRVATEVLGWCTGDRLTLAATSTFVLIRRDQDGLSTLPPRARIAIPAALRRRCRLSVGDQVLLAAYLSLDALAAYSLAAVDQALHPLTRHTPQHGDRP